jgi:hypothetical protein
LPIVFCLFVLSGSPVYAFCLPWDKNCQAAEKATAEKEQEAREAEGNREAEKSAKEYIRIKEARDKADAKIEADFAKIDFRLTAAENQKLEEARNRAKKQTASSRTQSNQRTQSTQQTSSRNTNRSSTQQTSSRNTNRSSTQQTSSRNTNRSSTQQAASRNTNRSSTTANNSTNSSTNSRTTEFTEDNSSTTQTSSTDSPSDSSNTPSQIDNNSYTDSPSSSSNSFKSAQYGGIAGTESRPVQENQGIDGYADNLVNQFGLPTNWLDQLIPIFTQLLQTLVHALMGEVQSLIGGFNPIQQPSYLQNPNSNIANIGNHLGGGVGNILGRQLLGPIAGGALNVFPQNQYPQNFNPAQYISTAANTFPVQLMGNQAQLLLQPTYNQIFNNHVSGGQGIDGIQQVANNIAQPEQNTLFRTQTVIREIKYPRGTVFRGETINMNGKLVASGKGVKHFTTLPGAYCEGIFQNGQADCLYNNGDRWIGSDLEDPNMIGSGTIIKKDGNQINGTYQGDKLISR